MKSKVMISVTFLVILALSIVLIGCDKKDDYIVPNGLDEYGREYGQIYDIDKYESGIYHLSYDLLGLSSFVESMIRNNCADYVEVEVNKNGEYYYTFYSIGEKLTDVSIKITDTTLEGEIVKENNKVGYEFKLNREQLDNTITIYCKVSAMFGKSVDFDMKIHIDKAKLVG